MAMPQTAYNLDQPIAIAGMVADRDPGQLVVGEFVASEDIPYGRLVEIDPTATSGHKKCRLPATATAVGTQLGVSVYSPADPVGGIKAGDTVRVLRRGRIWAEYTGTAGSDMGTAMKVRSASTNGNSEATHRGKFTDAATSAVAGSEIYATKMLCMQETATGFSPAGLVMVELNGPLT